jgi:ubiquinone/menaquinone biosynthesis C-methylase UbiE
MAMLPSGPEALSTLSIGVVVTDAISPHASSEYFMHGKFSRLLLYLMMTRTTQLTRSHQWLLSLLLMSTFVVMSSEARSQAATLTNAQCEYVTLKTGHPDGILKQYCNRQIAKVMGWQGASWLDRAERESEERTDQLIDILNVKPGMIVGDIGAGTGRLSMLMLDRIKPQGQMWAVDVQAEMVGRLKEIAQKYPKHQFEVKQSTALTPNLPSAVLDMAIMVDVYHELEFPREFLEALALSVKPGGSIVFVEYRAGDPKVPIKRLHTMTVAQIKKEASDVGLVFEKVVSDLPWQDVVFFRKP